MSAVAGPNQRYYLMSRRWSVLGVTSAITVVLVGLLLDHYSFPLNYQVVFIASFAGGLLSFAFSSRIEIPDNDPADAAGETSPSPRKRLREGLAALRENAAYSRFLVSQFVFRCGWRSRCPCSRSIGCASCTLPLVDRHHQHGQQRRADGGLLYLVGALASQRQRVGAVGLRLRPNFYPLLTGLTHSVPPLAIYAGLAGIFGAGIDLVLFDILLSTCPPRHQASYIALYQTTTYIATFLAPTLGTFIADSFGYAPALFVGSGLRFAGAALFVILGVGAAAGARGMRGDRPAQGDRGARG